MTPAVPIAGLLAALGIYGVVMGIIALRNPDKLNQYHSNLQEPIEWVAVICISLFGLLAWAAALAVSFGTPPWVPFLVSVPVVGLLGVVFFKSLEITPTPIFALMVNTRLFGGRRRRRSLFRDMKRMWVESSIDGDILQHDADEHRRLKSRNASRGAFSLAVIMCVANAIWLVKLDDALDIGFLILSPLPFLFFGLYYVLARAGVSLAERSKGIDWRRPF